MNSVEAYITCPYNKSHRILKHRFQTHLYKCRKQHPDMKVVCLYDATHMLDTAEFEHHMSVCPSSGNIKCYQNVLEAENNVGTVSLEEACAMQTNTLDEDWSGNCVAYDPLTASETKNVIRTTVGLSKSMRKQFKQRERDRMSSLQTTSYNNSSNEINILEKQTYSEQPLRKPKNAAKAISCVQSSSTDDLASKVEELSIKKNNSLTNKNVSKDKQNVSNKENNAITICRNIFATEENISEVKGDYKMNTFISQKNESEKQENYKKTSIQTGDFKKNDFESLKTLQIKPKIANNLYGEVRKISTGRGFTIAYKNLNSSILKSEKDNENSKDLSSVYGYDDD
ncbi:Gametocyte-specific factor 1 [Habropoda laboriosa]|uniref:Gametocyte-specific factor 1 n=1 Tax=Habropoda laboriosa TaxID=597456 RepID=A0A0L7RGV3_9HYME|nr:Gametocyte-specific factor 1 [Habropoda laboriosa]